MPQALIPLSTDRRAYAGLHTDHWPWPEALADLSARAAFSGALDVQDGARLARFMWADGQALGGQLSGTDIETTELAVLMRGFPRARLTLTPTEPEVAGLLWRCRKVQPQPSNEAWATLHAKLARPSFHGVVLAGAGASFWQGGARVGGPEPLEDERPGVLTAVTELTPVSLMAFWNDVLDTVAPMTPISTHWLAAATALADDHPCMDPFAQEVILDGGQLRLLGDVPVEELSPALLATFLASLRRARLHLRDLPLARLHTHALWGVSGLAGRA